MNPLRCKELTTSSKIRRPIYGWLILLVALGTTVVLTVGYNDIITAQQLIDLVAFLHDRYETTRPATD